MGVRLFRPRDEETDLDRFLEEATRRRLHEVERAEGRVDQSEALRSAAFTDLTRAIGDTGALFGRALEKKGEIKREDELIAAEQARQDQQIAAEVERRQKAAQLLHERQEMRAREDDERRMEAKRLEAGWKKVYTPVYQAKRQQYLNTIEELTLSTAPGAESPLSDDQAFEQIQVYQQALNDIDNIPGAFTWEPPPEVALDEWWSGSSKAVYDDGVLQGWAVRQPDGKASFFRAPTPPKEGGEGAGEPEPLTQVEYNRLYNDTFKAMTKEDLEGEGTIFPTHEEVTAALQQRTQGYESYLQSRGGEQGPPPNPEDVVKDVKKIFDATEDLNQDAFPDIALPQDPESAVVDEAVARRKQLPPEQQTQRAKIENRAAVLFDKLDSGTITDNERKELEQLIREARELEKGE